MIGILTPFIFLWLVIGIPSGIAINHAMRIAHWGSHTPHFH